MKENKKNWGTIGRWMFGWMAASLLLSVLLSWPLPRFATHGIPASAQNIEQPPWRYSIHGDHLQLLYHFDLMREMLKGDIPWFFNPYEFNVGSPEERYRPGAYFFPFSGLYAALVPWSNQALAWNLTWWFSVALSALFMAGWLRRFTQDRMAIALGVLIALLLPFRWISIFGGSPAGMALCWLPLLAWGVDVAVRQASWRSGAWVGATLLLTYWGDLQVFYFALLALPVFFAMSWLSAYASSDPVPWKQWYRVIPLGLVFLGLLASYHLWRKGFLTESLMGDGRSLREVQLFSPRRSAIFHLGSGVDGSIFIGWMTATALLMGTLFMLVRTVRDWTSARWQSVIYAGVALVTLLTIALALGTNGPRRAWLLREARDFLPYYDMIRQPFKIYALMTLWLGWLLAVGWTGFARESMVQRRWRWALAVLVGVGMTVEMNQSVSATVSLFQQDQGAYAAVARDARETAQSPARALVVPLWPGESADTSLAIYYAHRHHIQLVNGYSPVVSRDYFENVFRRLESVNQGWLKEDQMDFLLASGVHYLILHENQFPEKVSPFPVTLTRDRLMAHPRLQPLAQDGPIWAFRILDETHSTTSIERVVSTRFPTRRWNFDRMGHTPEQRVEDAEAHGGAYLVLKAEDEDVWAGPWRVAPDDDLRWLLRLRGKGTVRIDMLWEDLLSEGSDVAIDAQDWEWIAVPVPRLPDFGQIQFRMHTLEGVVEADTGLLMLGEWGPLQKTETQWTFAAADFFHAGYSDTETQSVHFRPDHDPADGVLYGPKLPLLAGKYRLDWLIETDAAPGVEVGAMVLHDYVTGQKQRFPVIAGTPTRIEWTQPHSHLVNWTFIYHRVAPVTIRSATLTRLPSIELDEDAAP